MMTHLHRLYDWTLNISRHRHAERWLAALAFTESSFFPIPPDVALMPMCVARPEKSWRYAFLCTFSSALGGLFGYAIGHFLFESLGVRILEFYGAMDSFHAFQQKFNDFGFWIVFAAAFTPIPYKVITIASGVTGLSLPLFFITSVLGRGMRFYLVAGLLKKYGVSIRIFIEKYLGVLTIIFTLFLILGFITLKCVF